MELTDQQVIDLFTELGEIKAQLAAGPTQCAVHSEQIRALTKAVEAHDAKLAAVQTVIGKKELIVAAFGALGFGIAWALKALIGLSK